MKKYIYWAIAIILLLTTASSVVHGQESKVVFGTVYELIDGEKVPLIGGNVVVMNKQNRSIAGTAANVSGYYSIRIPEDAGDVKIVFSYIGMQSQTFDYTGQQVLNVTLRESTVSLGEVMIEAARIERDGMGITAREQTAATQKIEIADVVESMPVSSVEEALQGRLAGVDILTGGDPGARSSIRIRGTATLNTSADPLIVINGVPYSTKIDDTFDFATANNDDYAAMLNLSPYDIESIEVLKDAASTAIYGTKGANGVLLIRTKKGAMGKTRFSFNSKYSISKEPNPIPMLNGNDYVAFIQDAIWNTANAQGTNNSKQLLDYLYDTPEINFMQDWRYFNEYNAETDWLSYITRDAITWDNNFSMSGGGEKATYRFSLSNTNEQGITIGNSMNRLTSSLNIDYRFSEKLRVGADFSYSGSDVKNNWASNIRLESMLKMPNKSPFVIDKETGKPTSTYFTRQNQEEFQGAFNERDGGGARNYHPIIMAKDSYNKSKQSEERMTFFMDYDILEGLRFSTHASIRFKTNKMLKFVPQIATGVTVMNPFANQSVDAYTDNFDLQTESKLIYRKRFNNDHNIVATGLWRTASGNSSAYSTTTYGAASADLSDPVTGASIYQRGSGESEGRSLSGIGSLNYTFKDKYTFSGTVNIEGNSSLGKDERWGMFPAVGFAWHMKEEEFLKYQDWIGDTKFRVSYGQSGSAPSGTAPYMGTYTSLGEYNDNPVVAPVSMQLNKLKWESSTEYNIGIDLGLFHNKITMTFDYYYKHTKDLLQRGVSIPSSTGYNHKNNQIAYFNDGEMSNQGIEYRIDYTVFSNKDWTISTNLNLSRNINVIDVLPEYVSTLSGGDRNGSYAQKIISGTPVGSFFGYKYLGVYQNIDETYARDINDNVMKDFDGDPIVMKNMNQVAFPGDARYLDVNHDGVINQKDIVYLGNSNPLLTGGGGFMVRYKRVALTSFFHYRIGQKIINMARMDSESMYGANNQSTAVLRRWRNEGDDTTIPRALWQYGYNYLGSDRFVEDCSFLRLKTLYLSYDLPKEICQKVHTNSIKAFITGYNLFTWTNYTGQDPEVNLPIGIRDLAIDNAQTPRSAKIAGGVTINF